MNVFVLALHVYTVFASSQQPNEDGWVGNFSSVSYQGAGCTGATTGSVWIQSSWQGQRPVANCVCSFGNVNGEFHWFEQCYDCAGATMTQKLCKAPGCTMCTLTGTVQFVGGFPKKQPWVGRCTETGFTPEGSTTPIYSWSKVLGMTTASGNISFVFPCA